MSIALIVVPVLVVVACVVALLIARARMRRGLDAAHSTGGALTEEESARVAKVTEAYRRGEIDERMVGAAARVLGIERQEAIKRLEQAGALDGAVTTTGRAPARPADRDKRRKKNKQARRSRQGNRR